MATRKTIIVITFFCFLFLILSIPADAKTSTSDNDHLKIHFINVGQGDAIFIQTPKGKTVLVDSGSDLTKRKVISYLKSQGVKTLNLVIVTHPHPDHIGAMPDILKEFKVDTFYMADLKDETPLFTNLQKVIIDQGIFVFRPHLDEALELEKDLVFKFIAPTPGNYESLNEYSSVIQVTYKKNRFLLMADAGEQSEAEMMNRGVDLQADVIKIAHHGGETGNTLPFLRAVNPQAAIISSDGRKNYPSEEVINRLKYLKVPIYRTDQLGTIVVHSNGDRIWFTNDGSKENHIE